MAENIPIMVRHWSRSKIPCDTPNPQKYEEKYTEVYSRVQLLITKTFLKRAREK